MEGGKQYKVSAKKDGKWWSFGNLKKNQYGNWSIGLKVNEDLKNLIRSKNDGEWLNLSLFEDKPKDKASSPVSNNDDLAF